MIWRTASACGRRPSRDLVTAPSHVLESAGFVDVALERVDAPMRFGDDADDAFTFVSTLGITRGLPHDLDEDTSTQAVDCLRRAIGQHDGADGVAFAVSAWVVTARSPGSYN